MANEATDIVAGTLLVLSGPPGSGKTTIARALADAAERSTVHLVTDLFYIAIRKGVRSAVPAGGREAERSRSRRDRRRHGRLRERGYDVIVDGIVGPWSSPLFVRGADRAGCKLSFVVLRPSLDETMARAVAREGRELKASGPIKGLYGAFANLGVLERHAIDTSGETVQRRYVFEMSLLGVSSRCRDDEPAAAPRVRDIAQ